MIIGVGPKQRTEENKKSSYQLHIEPNVLGTSERNKSPILRLSQYWRFFHTRCAEMLKPIQLKGHSQLWPVVKAMCCTKCSIGVGRTCARKCS